MAFFIGLIQVVVVAFGLFYVAQMMLRSVNPERSFGWCLTVGIMSFGVMVVHKLLDNGINIPFNTVLLFILALGGMDANMDKDEAQFFIPTIKKARWFAIVGGLAGWLTHAEVVKM